MGENPTKTRKKLRKQRKTPCFLNINTVLIWQGHKDLNPEPTVLETAALPIELYPYVNIKGASARIGVMVGPQGFEPGTIRL